MIAGSFVPPVAYVFRCSTGWRDFYLGSMFVLAVLTAAISLPDRFQASFFIVLAAALLRDCPASQARLAPSALSVGCPPSPATAGPALAQAARGALLRPGPLRRLPRGPPDLLLLGGRARARGPGDAVGGGDGGVLPRRGERVRGEGARALEARLVLLRDAQPQHLPRTRGGGGVRALPRVHHPARVEVGADVRGGPSLDGLAQGGPGGGGCRCRCGGAVKQR